MKRLLLIIIFALPMNFLFGQANVYHLFPDSNAVWVQEYYYLNGNQNWVYVDFDVIISGDTTLGNYTYHKLYRIGFTSELSGKENLSMPKFDFYRTYYGAFRQDSANKRIYMFDDWDERDTLAYDFNLNVGDSLPLTFIYSTCMSVLSIDSVLVANQYHRRFWLIDRIDSRIAELIEGVGSSFGSFETIGNYFESGAELHCVVVDNEMIYTFNSNYPCLVINRLENQTLKIEISICPNPFSTYSKVNVNKDLNNATLTIYNSLGEEVKHLEKLRERSITIQRDNLPSGVYFIRLTEGQVIVASSKILITD